MLFSGSYPGVPCKAPRTSLPSRRKSRGESFGRVCALLLTLASGLTLAACQTAAPPPPPKPAFTPVPEPLISQYRGEQPQFFRLRHTSRTTTPVRVALLLPLSNPSADTRAIADALSRAAEMAVLESGNPNIILMPRDDGGSPERAAAAAAKAIDDGAEIILGPLFAQSVTAVAPVSRARGIPVIAFSSDRAVGGQGVYLLSFQPETEVNRIVSYAARRGHTSFAALVPQTPYGEKIAGAFRETVTQMGARMDAVENFAPYPDRVGEPARRVAALGSDAVLIAQDGAALNAIAPVLALSAQGGKRAKFLGTGLWDNAATAREPMLAGGWYAAPQPNRWRSFTERYKTTFDLPNDPPRIATLAYDAVTLVALLSSGAPFKRYTNAALTDPNGFSGVDGIFRFKDNGAADRGLAIMEVSPNGASVVDQAPSTFQNLGF